MVFASIEFLFVFLPLNLLLYALLRSDQHRNLLLTFFSLAFYAWGEPVWITLLLFSATVDYIHGRVIERYRGTDWAKAALISSLGLNLGLLGLFKYSGFLYRTINQACGTSFDVPEFTLPIGISFYTFQTISYVVDVYRGDVRAQRSYPRFLMFVSLYHQLVAGPIVRYADIAAEIDTRRVQLSKFSEGVTRFATGLCKKVCIANVAGELVGRYMDADASTLSCAEAWFGLAMFSLQIYYDFSGYSDMAIGLGQMFGFTYLENFNYPYVSQSVSEFWRRWHISLGSFFRDYVYIPLGGNRRHPVRNLFIVWFLTGLWHGASWNFVLWGLYFGILIYLEKNPLKPFFTVLPSVLRHAYLVFVAVLGWAIFYFTDITAMAAYMKVLFTPLGGTESSMGGGALSEVIAEHALWLLTALVLCTPIYVSAKTLALQWASVSRTRVNALVCAAMFRDVSLLILSTVMLVGGTHNPFLYFRF